jgi:uncharacterized protein YbbC (DUF1343 family)
LGPLLQSYDELSGKGVTFFTRPDFFDLLAGSDELRKMIEAGATEEDIRKSWAKELEAYTEMRKRYMLYP